MRTWNPNTKSTGRPGDWTPPLRQTVPVGAHCVSAHWATEAGDVLWHLRIISKIELCDCKRRQRQKNGGQKSADSFRRCPYTWHVRCVSGSHHTCSVNARLLATTVRKHCCPYGISALLKTFSRHAILASRIWYKKWLISRILSRILFFGWITADVIIFCWNLWNILIHQYICKCCKCVKRSHCTAFTVCIHKYWLLGLFSNKVMWQVFNLLKNSNL